MDSTQLLGDGKLRHYGLEGSPSASGERKALEKRMAPEAVFLPECYAKLANFCVTCKELGSYLCCAAKSFGVIELFGKWNITHKWLIINYLFSIFAVFFLSLVYKSILKFILYIMIYIV